MKPLTVVAVGILMVFAFLAGNSVHSVLAQQGAAGPSTEKLPADVFPESRNRSPKATRDEMTTDEDKAAFDAAVAKGNVAYSGWNGIRLHVPIVHTAYRTAIQTLDKENESRYQS